MQEEDTFSVDQSAGDINLNAICTLIFTDVEDYNRIGGQQVSLAPDEVLVYTNMDAPYPYDTLSVLDRTFTVKGVLEELPDARVYSANTGTNVFYVITDSMDTVWICMRDRRPFTAENASSMDISAALISQTQKNPRPSCRTSASPSPRSRRCLPQRIRLREAPPSMAAQTPAPAATTATCPSTEACSS